MALAKKIQTKINKHTDVAGDVELLRINLYIDAFEIKTEILNNEALQLFDYIDSILESTPKKSSKYKLYLMVLKKITKKIEDFETKAYKIEKLSPMQKIKNLMQEHSLKQIDLAPIVGSQGYISDILKGKREVSVTVAKKLGEYFKLSPAYFLGL